MSKIPKQIEVLAKSTPAPFALLLNYEGYCSLEKSNCSKTDTEFKRKFDKWVLENVPSFPHKDYKLYLKKLNKIIEIQ